MYALVIDNTVQSVGRLPNSARRLDTGDWVMGLASAPTALVEACGWFPVIDTPPTYDPATEVLVRGDVIVVQGSVVVDYTVRDKTPEELASEADAADRQAKGVHIGQAVTWLRTKSAEAEAHTATSTNAVATLNAILDNLAVFYDGFADLLEYQGVDRLGEG